jgi:hypothetical protein
VWGIVAAFSPPILADWVNHVTARVTLIRCFTVLVAALALVPGAVGQEDPLSYQERPGGYREGIDEEQVDGTRVALVSALIRGAPLPVAWPPQLRLRFYLPSAAEATIAVRELRPLRHYRLEVSHRPNWTPGFDNIFPWLSGTVLQQLGPKVPGPEALGVVVRLTGGDPELAERIAPAILTTGPWPRTADRYRFTFRASGAANDVGATLLAVSSNRRFPLAPVGTVAMNEPFSFDWDGRSAPEGEYRIKVSGTFEQMGLALAKQVSFLHVRRVDDEK